MNVRTTAALIGSVAIVAAGCSDGGSSSNPTPTPVAATATPAATNTPPPTATVPATATPPPTATPIGLPQCFPPTLDAALCDPDVASFTLASTNPYYPLVPGLRVVLEGEEDGEIIRVERTVLEDTEIVAGVETHVLEHRELIDGEIHEVARNFYVEASDGTVCYFGEDVEFYEDGELVDRHGSWRAGVDGAKPGIIMPANPTVGDAYFQENAPPDIALDMGRVSDVGVTGTIGGVTYDDLVIIQDSNPLEDCDGEEEKVYAPGIGEIVDDVLEIIAAEEPVLSAAKLHRSSATR